MKASDFLPSQLVAFDEPPDPQLESAAELEEVARHLDLEPWILQRLLHPERELTTNLVINGNNGNPLMFTGYRVQHLTSRGPTLGGVSFSPHAYLAGVRASAMQATWQAALLNLPFGGAAGAVVCNPDELSEDELRQLTKNYAHALRGIVGRFDDVLAPGLGCHSQMIAWMLDSIAHDSGRVEPGAATGKPEFMYGLPDYAGMTTEGVLSLIEALLERRETRIAGQRVSIQGFGKLGTCLARALFDRGARIVAIADISGGLCNSKGIDLEALEKYVLAQRLIFGFAEADSACNAEVLEADCDILIAAAAERQITAANAPRISAALIFEVAKSAITAGAEQRLLTDGKIVIPEILTTAGAAIAAFLEWNLGAQYSAVSSSIAQAEVKHRTTTALDMITAQKLKGQCSLRRAAHTIAVDQIAREIRVKR